MENLSLPVLPDFKDYGIQFVPHPSDGHILLRRIGATIQPIGLRKQLLRLFKSDVRFGIRSQSSTFRGSKLKRIRCHSYTTSAALQIGPATQGSPFLRVGSHGPDRGVRITSMRPKLRFGMAEIPRWAGRRRGMECPASFPAGRLVATWAATSKRSWGPVRRHSTLESAPL